MGKMPFNSVVKDEFNYLNGICEDSELSITAYQVDYNTDEALVWGTEDVTTDGDCEDLTAICGDGMDEYGFSLFASISFYCGDCDDLISLFEELLVMMDNNEFTPMYTSKCMNESVSFDSICLDGFGSIDVTDYVNITSSCIAWKCWMRMVRGSWCCRLEVE